MVIEEVVIWSASCGALAALTLVSLVRAVRHRTWIAWDIVLWLVLATHFELLMTGLTLFVYPLLPADEIRTAQVLIGPIWVSISIFIFQYMMNSWQRSRAMNSVMWFFGLCGLVSGLAIALAEPIAVQLYFSECLMLGLIGVIVVVAVWSGLTGDRVSWGMALACTIGIPVLAGLYGFARHDTMSLGLQITVALATPLTSLLVVHVAQMRDHHQHQANLKTLPEPDRDPLTKLYNSASIARKIVAAQKRQRWMQGSGVVIGVNLLGSEMLLRQYGQAGLDAVLVRMGARLELELGYINPVGRYDGLFFIVLVETVHSTQRLDSMLNGMVQQLRRPITVNTTQGEAEKISPSIGVGFVTLSPRMNVETVLFNVQAAARQNRKTDKPSVNNEAVYSLPPETIETLVKPSPSVQGHLSFKKHSAAVFVQ